MDEDLEGSLKSPVSENEPLSAVELEYLEDPAGKIVREEILTILRNFASGGANEQDTADKLALRELEIARVDRLTGLDNKTSFNLDLAREVSRAQRTGEPVNVFMLDANKFKAINDHPDLGHLTGDILLKTVAETMLVSLRESDIKSRFGGDEFAGILKCDPKTAIEIVKRIQEFLPVAVTLRVPKEIINHPLIKDFSVSIGLATLESGEIPDIFLDRADKALYVAKASGPGQIAVSKFSQEAKKYEPEVISFPALPLVA